MVVLKDTKDSLSSIYGEAFLPGLRDFSDVIGYTLEEEDGEIKIEFNPDRPDLFSFSGIFNSLEIYGGRRNWVPLKFRPDGLEFIVDPGARKLRPYALGFRCTGREIGRNFRDLIDFQEKIHQSIGKNRSKVSIGIHDLRNITPPITFKAAGREEISFTTYDGLVSGTAAKILATHPKGIEFSRLIPGDSSVPVISDSAGNVLSMPPVVNGDATSVSEGTSDFFIDITGTDRKALRDAFFLLSYYFQVNGYGLCMAETRDGRDILKYDSREIVLKPGQIRELAGIDMGPAEVSGLLRKMGYSTETLGRNTVVRVPGNRIDVMGPADVIEDLAKAYGYGRMQPVQPSLSVVGSESSTKPLHGGVRNILVGSGFQEIMSFVVTSTRFYEKVKYAGGVEVRNPKSLDFSMVRDRLYLGVLDFFSNNRRRQLPQRVFEIGEIVRDAEQRSHLCIGITSSRAGYSEIKQALDTLLTRMGVSDPVIGHSDMEGFVKGRCGSITLSGRELGVIGEIHPSMLEHFELRNPVSMLEIDLGALVDILDQGT